MIGPLEIAANGFATAAILLAGRNSIHTWWTGIVGCLLLAVVFLQAKLYADVVLQVFFVLSSAPFGDSMVLVFSVIVQLLLMGRRIENWPFWLLVNSIAVPLYASRELYLTAFLYALYWVNAIVAWLKWGARAGKRRAARWSATAAP